MYSSGSSASTTNISNLERQVNDICSMLTKTVADVANVYEQNTNLMGYKTIVGQVVSGLPQYQEMECENKRLLAENLILKRRIETLEAENQRLLDESREENILLEIEVGVDEAGGTEQESLVDQELSADESEGDVEEEAGQELLVDTQEADTLENDVDTQDSMDESDSDLELEEVEIDGVMYFVEVGEEDEKRAIFNIAEDDEVGDEIGFMLNGEAEFE
jgi:hypothetical protein